MKFSISLALLTVFALASCVDEPPPQQEASCSALSGTARPNILRRHSPSLMRARRQTSLPRKRSPRRLRPRLLRRLQRRRRRPRKGIIPYGVPVPGKPGFVSSPYSPDQDDRRAGLLSRNRSEGSVHREDISGSVEGLRPALEESIHGVVARRGSAEGGEGWTSRTIIRCWPSRDANRAATRPLRPKRTH